MKRENGSADELREGRKEKCGKKPKVLVYQSHPARSGVKDCVMAVLHKHAVK